MNLLQSQIKGKGKGSNNRSYRKNTKQKYNKKYTNNLKGGENDGFNCKITHGLIGLGKNISVRTVNDVDCTNLKDDIHNVFNRVSKGEGKGKGKGKGNIVSTPLKNNKECVEIETYPCIKRLYDRNNICKKIDENKTECSNKNKDICIGYSQKAYNAKQENNVLANIEKLFRTFTDKLVSGKIKGLNNMIVDPSQQLTDDKKYFLIDSSINYFNTIMEETKSNISKIDSEISDHNRSMNSSTSISEKKNIEDMIKSKYITKLEYNSTLDAVNLIVESIKSLRNSNDYKNLKYIDISGPQLAKNPQLAQENTFVKLCQQSIIDINDNKKIKNNSTIKNEQLRLGQIFDCKNDCKDCDQDCQNESLTQTANRIIESPIINKLFWSLGDSEQYYNELVNKSKSMNNLTDEQQKIWILLQIILLCKNNKLTKKGRGGNIKLLEVNQINLLIKLLETKHKEPNNEANNSEYNKEFNKKNPLEPFKIQLSQDMLNRDNLKKPQTSKAKERSPDSSKNIEKTISQDQSATNTGAEMYKQYAQKAKGAQDAKDAAEDARMAQRRQAEADAARAKNKEVRDKPDKAERRSTDSQGSMKGSLGKRLGNASNRSSKLKNIQDKISQKNTNGGRKNTKKLKKNKKQK